MGHDLRDPFPLELRVKGDGCDLLDTTEGPHKSLETLKLCFLVRSLLPSSLSPLSPIPSPLHHYSASTTGGVLLPCTEVSRSIVALYKGKIVTDFFEF